MIFQSTNTRFPLLTLFQEPESYEAYHERLFVPETDNAVRLKSNLTNENYLDAISAPRIDPSGRKKKRPLTKKQMNAIELAEDDVEVHPDLGDAAAEEHAAL